MSNSLHSNSSAKTKPAVEGTAPSQNNNHHQESRVYTISLRKRENGGLGFLIRQRDEMPYFSIWEIIKNGAADQNGKMKIGDIILKVNNDDISGYSYERGLDLLKSFKPGHVVNLTLQSCDPNELAELKNFHLLNKAAIASSSSSSKQSAEKNGLKNFNEHVE
jgi:C-terminal processing protease CtpA/Prc